MRAHIWQTRSWQIYPSQVAISQIPTLRTHIWKTRSWYVHPSLSLSQMTISQIPTMRAHIWQTRSWQIYPSQVAISQIPTLRTHIWQTRSWYVHPLSLCLKWQFHRFLLWELIFDRSGLDISTQTPQWFHRFLPWGLIFGRPGLCRSSSPHQNSDFTDSYSESSYLADQVLGDLSPQMASDFTDSYSEGSYLVPGLGIYTSFFECAFHRFLHWEFIFGKPGLGRPTPLSLSQMTISQIPTLMSSYLANQV